MMRSCTSGAGSSPGRWTRRAAVLAGAALVALMIQTLPGCGKSPYLRLSALRAASFSQPVWVGFFLAKDATALAGVDTAELVERPETFAGSVLYHQVFPVHPGSSQDVTVPIEGLGQPTGWLVIVANVPEAKPCARYEQEVALDARLSLRVDVLEDCLEVTRAK